MKPPGGELTIWSAIWILVAIGSLYFAIFMGMTGYYLVAALVGLPALGMWFDQRWCGYLFAALMVISIPLALIALVLVDGTLPQRIGRLVKMGSAGYFAYITFQWARDG